MEMINKNEIIKQIEYKRQVKRNKQKSLENFRQTEKIRS